MPTGLILGANLTAAGLLGVERNQLISKPFSQFILKESQDVFYLHRGRVLENTEQQSCNIKLKIKSGHERYAQLESILTKDSQGDTLIMTSLIDITARMKAEEDRELLLRELARKNIDLEQLIYITSHDLRTPLVNIEGYSRELSMSLEEILSAMEDEEVPFSVRDKILSVLTKDVAESMRVIHSSISKMDTLISGILKFSRTGKTELSIEDFDMNKVMADVASNFQFSMKESGAKIEISPLLSCRGDPKQLNQLFCNLLDNAMKHSDPDCPCIIKIHSYKEADQSVYCIEDNGWGIAPQHLEKIFDIFYRLDQRNVMGEGLGLAIANKIAEMHNGKIWIESEPGKGSRFYVSLPA